IDQSRVVRRDLRRPFEIVREGGLVIDELHAAPAEHIGRTHQNRVAAPLRHRERLVRGRGGAEGGGRKACTAEQLAEPAAIVCPPRATTTPSTCPVSGSAAIPPRTSATVSGSTDRRSAVS